MDDTRPSPPPGHRAFLDTVRRDDEGHWVCEVLTWDAEAQQYLPTPPLPPEAWTRIVDPFTPGND